jgi:surfeit locus 1 family protein
MSDSGLKVRDAASTTPHVGPRFRPMPVLTILTLICLGILWILGQWQWDKYATKTKAPKMVAALEATSVAAALESPNPEYQPVSFDGVIDSRLIKVNSVQDGVRGYRLFSPVVLDAGSIFIDRGFIDETNLKAIAPLSGQVTLNGVLRIGAKANQYTLDNDPAKDVWFWPDLTAMSDKLGIAPMSTARAATYYVALNKVDPMGTGRPIVNPYADSKGANQIPPERHLGYALTWWGFGFALLGVYTGLHVRTGRLRLGRAPAHDHLS